MAGGRCASRAALGLILAALLCVGAFAAWSGVPAWKDSGWFAVVLFGIPLLAASTALWVERASRTVLAPVVLAALGAVSLAWSLLTALGIGLGFLLPSVLLPSVLLLFAAAASGAHRANRDPSASKRP